MYIYRLFMGAVVLTAVLAVGVLIYGLQISSNAEQQLGIEMVEPVPSVITALSWYSYMHGLEKNPEISPVDVEEKFHEAVMEAISDIELPRPHLSASEISYLDRLSAWLYKSVEADHQWKDNSDWIEQVAGFWLEASEVFSHVSEVKIAAITALTGLEAHEAFPEAFKEDMREIVKELHATFPEDHRVYQLAEDHLATTPAEVVETYLDCLDRMPDMHFCYQRYHESVQAMLAVSCDASTISQDLEMLIGFTSSSDDEPWHFEADGVRYRLVDEPILDTRQLQSIVVKPGVASADGFWPGRLEIQLTPEGAEKLFQASQYFLGQRLAILAGGSLVAAPVIAGPIDSASGSLQINVMEEFDGALVNVCPTETIGLLPKDLRLEKVYF